MPGRRRSLRSCPPGDPKLTQRRSSASFWNGSAGLCSGASVSGGTRPSNKDPGGRKGRGGRRLGSSVHLGSCCDAALRNSSPSVTDARGSASLGNDGTGLGSAVGGGGLAR